MKLKAISGTHRRRNGYALLIDVLIIAFGILATYGLAKIGAIDALIFSLKNYGVIASFSAGIFFTSTFTVAPAAVALVKLAEHVPVPIVAILGGLGAMFGDLILFYFIRDRFSVDIMNAMKPSTVRHILRSFHFGFLKWLAPLIGGLIIASPFPDEFGVSLMGLSKIKIAVLLPVSFISNVIGIYLIIAFANLIS